MAYNFPLATSPFQWAFTNISQQVSPYLTECQTLEMAVLPRAVNSTDVGVAPYYLMAFEPGGISTSAFIGTDPSHLTWQVDHEAGALLVLSMADANGNSGGISQRLTVLSGQDSSCVPSRSTSLAITSNVTSTLETCEPWGLKVTGAVPPYNITIAAVGSTVVTNVTIEEGYDYFTYINRAKPNGQMLAAVSDATGKFGKTTSLINTVGSYNVNCNNLTSTPGYSSMLGSGSKSKRSTVIIAVCVTVGGLITISAAVFLVFCMRRRAREARGIRDGQDTLPRVFKGPDTIDSPESFTLSPRRSTRSHHKQQMSNGTSTSLPEASQPASPSGSVIAPPGIPPNTSDPHDPPQHHAQHSDVPPNPASQEQGSPTTSDLPLSPITFATNMRRIKRDTRTADSSIQHTSSLQLPRRPFTAPQGSGTEPNIIIQHRDGGIVEELPPPYLDHRPPPPPQSDTEGS